MIIGSTSSQTVVSAAQNRSINSVPLYFLKYFYQILKYEGTPQKEIELTEKNEDSCGSEFYKISKLRKKDLSEIAILILENLGYNLN